MSSGHDPKLSGGVHPLWVHALRAQLDAVIVGAEAQVAGQLQGLAERASERHRELESRLTMQGADLARALATVAERDRALTALDAEKRRLEGLVEAAAREVEASAARVASLQRQLESQREEKLRSDTAHAEALSAMESRLGVMSQRAEVLDEQFAAERSFLEAALSARGTDLYDALLAQLGGTIELSPSAFSALKTRKRDAVLTAALRARGASRSELTTTERDALKALAAAADCELIEPGDGQRFNAHTMEKVATRAEPAYEGLVLGCVTPGLRLAGTSGSLLHPRVIVATG